MVSTDIFLTRLTGTTA